MIQRSALGPYLLLLSRLPQVARRLADTVTERRHGATGRRFLAILAVIATAASWTASAHAAAEVATSEPRPSVVLDDLAWLAGTWTGEKNGVRSEEIWTAPAGEMMLGLHRDVRGGRRAFFEYLRIEQTEDGIAFMASPAGRPAKGFPLVEAGESHVVFADPEHDFPQKLTYRREGDLLHVRAEGEGKEGRRVLEWAWELRDRCPGTAPVP